MRLRPIRSKASRRRCRLTIRELESRLAPAVTTAALTGGLLTVTCDGNADTLFLSVNGTGAFILTNAGAAQAISGSPTIANVTGIAIQAGGGGDEVDLSTVPAGTWTVVIDGGTGEDTVLGSQGTDLILGGTEDDSLSGNGGDDILDGGNGIDILNGGGGDDLIDSDTGSGTLFGGPGDDTLLGGASNDTMFGESGNDLLVGKGGVDIYTGGTGDDIFDGVTADSGVPDKVQETAVTDLIATDTTLFGMGFDQLLDIETVILLGNDGKNTLDASACTIPVSLEGGAGDDVLLGGSGNDTADGGVGNDVLRGNGGIDSLNGGDGNDSVVGGDGDDSLIGELGNDTLDGSAGIDQLIETNNVNFTLSNTKLLGLGTDKLLGIEEARLTGGSSANKLNASTFTGVTTLLGGQGNDTLIGGTGVDLLSGQEGVNFLNGGLGIDLLVENIDASMVLTNTRLTAGPLLTDTLANIERAQLTGGSSDNTMNASAFTLGSVLLIGGQGNDTLTGTGKNDSLRGAQGNDVIDGRGGIDTSNEVGDFNLTLVSTGATTATLTGSGAFGTDTLTNIEQASYFANGNGANNLDASGFNGPVTLGGGNGADTVTGGAGNDVLTGGAGNDDIDGGGGTDTLSESANDTTFTLANNSLVGNANGVGTDTLASIENATLTGGPASNTFVVSNWTGKATLDGGLGTDFLFSTNNLNFVLSSTKLTRSDGADFTLANIENANLTGGAGDNEFDVGGFKGTAALDSGGGTDAVVATRNVDMTLTNSTLLFGDGGSVTLNNITRARLTGGAGNNRIDASAYSLGPVVLKGFGGNDTLLGGSANDTLDGGLGIDRLEGGLGTDVAIGGEILLDIP